MGDYAEIYDPWAPEEVEERRRSRLERDEWRCAVKPLDAGDSLDMDWIGDRDDEGWTGGENEPEDGEFAPVHDIA